MKTLIWPAIVIALGLIVASFVISGRYQIVRASEAGAFRLDRWTGEFAICSQWEGGSVACANAPELYHDGKTPIFKNSN